MPPQPRRVQQPALNPRPARAAHRNKDSSMTSAQPNPQHNPQAAQQYLRTKVLTATPEQLQLMLYDGALRFGEQARVALQARKYDESYQHISQVQKILTELTCSLKPEVFPELCKKLAALYNYAYRQLIEANLT